MSRTYPKGLWAFSSFCIVVGSALIGLGLYFAARAEELPQPPSGQIVTSEGASLTMPCPTLPQTLTGRDLRLPHGCVQQDPAGRASLTLERYSKLRVALTKAEDLERHEERVVKDYERVIEEAKVSLLQAEERLRICRAFLDDAQEASADGPLVAAPDWVWFAGGAVVAVLPWAVGDAVGLGSWERAGLSAGLSAAGIGLGFGVGD